MNININQTLGSYTRRGSIDLDLLLNTTRSRIPYNDRDVSTDCSWQYIITHEYAHICYISWCTRDGCNRRVAEVTSRDRDGCTRGTDATVCNRRYRKPHCLGPRECLRLPITTDNTWHRDRNLYRTPENVLRIGSVIWNLPSVAMGSTCIPVHYSGILCLIRITTYMLTYTLEFVTKQ